MACYVDGRNTVYYLEPGEGLYRFNRPGEFVTGVAGRYQNRTWRCARPLLVTGDC